MARMERIKSFEVRHYDDSGATVAYCDWVDDKGFPGRTEGEPYNSHMIALAQRAEREGLKVQFTHWL